ncbi:TetR/AcrR family transcriptional regulator [Neorhizobium petrolearium]|uniref:TetR/AcrR family transcriptional regulator n=1 Tax=Neorhizobium petrolearium TaxID=515361 RepID=UPI001D123172|nr:TetR/AcrR family transcriptional regulator [Neorhizobium petrolearium]MCC2609478.1 TetR/AcrR family transcriptional regulator [Neorhizobium petrolearium]
MLRKGENHDAFIAGSDGLLKAKSTNLRGNQAVAKKPGTSKKKGKRLPYMERRAQILEKATELFSEYGLTAQTRALAADCGISQRLLYRFFPTKEDLLREVYDTAILGPFQAVWFAELSDRSRPMHDRLCDFYNEYLDAVLVRRWLRLFLYSSLAEADMAPSYISSIITKLMETIVAEAAHERGRPLNVKPEAIHEIGWIIHGAISHYGIRRHIYHASQVIPQEQVVEMHVSLFLSGFDAMIAQYAKIEA